MESGRRRRESSYKGRWSKDRGERESSVKKIDLGERNKAQFLFRVYVCFTLSWQWDPEEN
jgi:hypothetical protein